MKAWHLPRYSSIDDLIFADHETPKCSPEEVLIHIHAAALNPADLKLITGKDGGKFLHAANFPIIPGFDFSGVIKEAGTEVRDLKTGQAVFGFLPYARTTTQGTLAEYVCVNPEWVTPAPGNVPHDAAAAASTVGCTALQGLRDKGGLREGQHVLTNGASGGVGSFAVQIAKHAGATVWGTCSAKHMDFVRDLGADHVIDYRKTGIDQIDQTFDIIFDVACTSSFFEARSRLKRGGNYITLLPSLKLAGGILASIFSNRRCRFVVVNPNSRDLAQLAAWMAGGYLRAPVTSFPFSEAKKALHHLEERAPGKVVVINDNI